MGRFFWFGLLLLLPSVALSAVRDNIALSHEHDIWDGAAGFPGGYVYSITQTADGYLWIGTSEGLLRYDGLSFEYIRNSHGNTETTFSVPGLVTDSTDQLWATDDHTHLFRRNGDLLEGPLPDNGRHKLRTTSVGKTREGWPLFASESQGLVEYEHGGPHLLLDPGLIPNVPTAVTQTANGIFWIGTREMGVFRLNASTQELEPVAGLEHSKINCLLPIAGSTLLIGTDKGLLSLHNGKVTREPRRELGAQILSLANGQDGDVWIGIDGLVFKAQGKDIDADGGIHSLDKFSVRGMASALFEDRDGNLWIGEPETIERYRDTAFSSYLSSAGLPCSNCGAIYVDPQQRVWFAPWDGGLFRLSQGRIQPIEVAGLKDDTVYSIVGGASDEIWAARKYGGITRLHLQGDGVRASTFTRQNGLAQDAVYSIYRAPDGTIWAGTLNAGLSRFRAGRWRTFTTRDGLPSNTISAIAGNAAGEIFIGTPNGLAGLKNDHWVTYMTHNGLPPGTIESLLLDKADTLWVGTSKGISFLRSGILHVPLGAPNTLYGEILGMLENNGWLWITTNDHVLRVRCAALLNQSFEQGDYREFGVAEGLPSVAGVKRNNSVVVDDRGRLWFSLNQGISVLQPTAFAKPAFPVTIRLEETLVDGKPLVSGNPTHIPPGRHRLTFRYAGVNVSNAEDVRYRYRLNDVDSGWSEPTALREIDYTNIPPGRFRFEVIARNPDGIWSGQESSLIFEVEPAYYQTRWFQVTAVTALGLVVLTLYRRRLRQLHRQFKVGLEARVNERTRIARELHDTLLQSFHGLMFQFQAARNLLPRRPDEAGQVLDEAILGSEQALAESRDAIQDLRSNSATCNDLGQIIRSAGRELGESCTNSDSPVFDLVEEGERRPLSAASRDEISRITLEVLRNAFRHAEAHRIEAEIRYDERMLRVRIRDDGTGIDPTILKDGGISGHYGLRGVRERAQRIGAGLDFWSETGVGTEVQLAVPANIAYDAWHDTVASKLLHKVRPRA